MTSHITLTEGSNVVTIFTTKVEKDIQKTMEVFPVPRTRQEYDQGPQTNMIDLLQILKVFTITGYIGDVTGGDTAAQQRTKLENMIDAGGVVVMAYAGDNYNVNWKGCKITEETTDTDTPTTFKVMMTVIVGEDL